MLIKEADINKNPKIQLADLAFHGDQNGLAEVHQHAQVAHAGTSGESNRSRGVYHC